MNCQDFMRTVHDPFMGKRSSARGDELNTHAASCGACGPIFRTVEELGRREFVEFLDDYIDGCLAGDQRARLERHLESCTDCVTFLDSYRRTMSETTEALCSDDYAEPALPPALIQAILDARKDS